jgi:hypothetical protein
MKPLILILAILFLCTSCSVTYVNATKTVYVFSNGDVAVTITGSDLKGNTASQSADGKLSVPLVP